MRIRPKRRKAAGAYCCVFWAVALLITVPILIGSSYGVVDEKSWGLLRDDVSREVEQKTYPTGRYYTGLSKSFLLFPKNYQFIDLTGSSSVDARTSDGLRVGISAVIQYILREDKIFDVYNDYKTAWDTTYTQRVRNRIREVSSTYSATEFFTKRDQVTADMREGSVFVLADVNAKLVGFQLHQLLLPGTIEDNLKDIELQKQNARLKNAELELTKQEAQTDQRLAEEEAESNQLVAKLKQETQNLVRAIELNETRVREATNRILSQKNAELTSNLTLYNENTKRDEANILVKATLIAETTNQLVEGIRANTSLIVAAADVTLQRIDSESASDVERLVQAANADAESIRANAIANIFEQFTSEIGFTPTDLNTLEWTEMIRLRNSSELHFDIYQPGMLYLDGQLDTLRKSLDAPSK